MLSVAEAEKQVLEAVSTLPAEDCALAEAHGRVLRQPLVADRDLPPFDRVTMDGYALRHETWEGGVRQFTITGVQAAGAPPLALAVGDICIEVMTGAVLPTGADSVVPYEHTTSHDSVMTVASDIAVTAGQAVHRRGSDHAAGSLLVQPGVKLTGREIAVAAGCGYSSLTVAARPTIAVLATGDELVEVSSPVTPYQIRRSNDYALRAALIAAGYPLVGQFHVHDVRQEIEHQLWHIGAEYDVIVITGGASRGKFDFLPRVLEDLGVKKQFHGVAQRPGKPFWFGLSPRRTPVFALPGNPVSSYVCLHRYVLPALSRMSSLAVESPRIVVLAEKLMLNAQVASFVPVRITQTPRGEQQATPILLNTSGDLAGLTGTDGFVELPPGQAAFTAGAAVRFWPWV